MLKDIVVSTKKVEVDAEQSFVVQGLTLTDIGKLVIEYKEPIEALMENRLDLNSIADSYPEFMAKVIAFGAKEPESWENVKNLSFSVQLFAFEAIWDLTIPDYTALGKLIGRIKGIIPKSQESKEQDTKPESK